ncbi:hypothetical protein [Candidatus Methylocalor cossyra]
MKHPCWLLLASLALSGCGSWRDAFLGRATPLAPLEEARLGQTAREEIVHRYGPPDEVNARNLDATTREVVFYFDPYPGADQRPQYRFLACEFSKGVLTGYSFVDTGQPPRAGFDEQALARLVRGQSTRRQVESALGRPEGKALLPTTITLPALNLQLGGAPFPLTRIPDGAWEVWQYHQQAYDVATRKASQQTLSLFFDDHGVLLGSSLLRELTTKPAP